MERPRTQPEEPSRQAAASTGAGSKDLLGALLESRDDEGRPMEDSALRDELMTLLVAGQETSAILLGWTCALLAQAPEVQEQAAAEVARVLGDRAPAPSDARGSLPILEAVVLEALRVMPPAYLVGRCAARDAHVAGYTLPAGTTVLVSPYVMQRDPRWWGPDAGIFRPDRWMTPDDAQSGGGSAPPLSAAQALSGMGPNGAYIPFGAGQRNCIGAGFAMMEAVLVMAAVLQRFRLVPLPGAGMAEAEPRITLRPKAVKLILRQRKKGKVGSMSGGGAQTGVGEPQPPTVRASWVQSAL